MDLINYAESVRSMDANERRAVARGACASVERTTPRFHRRTSTGGGEYWAFIGALLVVGGLGLVVFSGVLS